jgi:DNA-binding LacI/PurR family transcriptional regulator
VDDGRRRRGVTLDDVARAAGVSRATASRALLEGGPASTPARARVRVVATQLGFQPDPAARALAGGTGTRIVIAVLAPTPALADCDYLGLVTARAAEVADEHGVGIARCRCRPPGSSPSWRPTAACTASCW